MSHHPQRNRVGFTLIELLVVISIIALLIGILLPALGRARIVAKQLQSNTQLRGMSQGLVIHAQGNNHWYTGFNSDGTMKSPSEMPELNLVSRGLTGATPAARFGELVSLGYVTPEYVIHPADPSEKMPWGGANDEAFDEYNYSYALNELGYMNQSDDLDFTQAREAWRDTLDTQTPTLSDRLYKLVGDEYLDESYIGMYSNNPGQLEIGVCWNDGHVSYSGSPVVGETRFGSIRNTSDSLYSRGHDDPFGNEQSGLTSDMNPDRGSSARMNSSGFWDLTQEQYYQLAGYTY